MYTYPEIIVDCVVVFKDTATDDDVEAAAAEVLANGGVLYHMFMPLLKGFSAYLPPTQFYRLQSSTGPDGLVDYIESDREMSIA
ncbi:hypothetical protein FISHEDRAFT_77422 [Fistulina hepatica ATCC 64428]|uniref:Uncharacterized protein n=1 Tax=Fistulina hepatica ATCC 64428 TaxID=1128425 RepID=A0A0D7A198_9AGAR|nr:hypothetical protein FISHEDRAFT_77422 [Fistulina hepatica ATCC 64428]